MLKLVIAAACITAPATKRDSEDVDLRCGSYSLFVCLRALGDRKLAFAQLEERLGQPTAKGYSMGQLAEAAQGYGLHTLGVKTSVERLQARPRPFACLALIDEAHFLVIADVRDGAALMVDAPRHYELPLDTLRTRWDGTALLISTSELLPEEQIVLRGRPWWWYAAGALVAILCLFIAPGLWRWRRMTVALILLAAWLPCAGCGPAASPRPAPVLHFKAFERDLGRIPKSSEPYVARFPFTNHGTAPLLVSRISTGCNCAVPSVSHDTLAPGENAEVIVKIKRPVPEDRRVTITLSTNDPLRPFFQLPLAWMTTAPVMFEPGALDVPSVLAGQTVEHDVKVLRHVCGSGDAIGDGSLRSSSPLLSACWAGDFIRGASECCERPLRVRIRADDAPAAFEGFIELGTGDPAEPPVSLPVRWRVRRLVEATPAEVFLGKGRAHGRLCQTIIIDAWHDARRLEVAQVGFAETDVPVTISRKRLGERAVALALDAQLPRRTGHYKWNLRVAVIEPAPTDLVVPISAIVGSVPD